MSGNEEENAKDRKACHDGAAGIDRGIDRLEERRSSKGGKRAAGELRGQRVRGGAEKVLARTTSGAIYAILVLVCIYLGPFATTLIVAAMAWLCCSEFFRMARMTGRMPNEIVGLTAAVIFPLAELFGGHEWVFLAVLLLLGSCAIWYVATPRATVSDVALSVFGPLYTSLMFSCIVLIRQCDPGYEGALLTVGVMGSVWLNDATAYFVGSRFGKHKLAPRISPHKSIEGFWGGLAGGLCVWIIVALLGVRGIELADAIPIGLLVGVSGVIGDLFESRIKRGVGVKDSGNLMPGHGGMLDRSDSMLFAGAVAALLLLAEGII